MALDHEKISACLTEIDRALFKAADHHDCKRFHVDSQLTAVVMLLIRCASLLRALLILFQLGGTDAFQVVLRAFEESWYLAHDLRLAEHSDRASRWLAEQNNSWSALLEKLKAFAIGRGLSDPTMGRDYGRLSQVSHPTKSAAMNSVTLCGARLDIDGAASELVEERCNEEARFPDALYRLIWLMLDQDKKFIPIHVKREDVPLCWKFFEMDKLLESST
jgi:hypothetical protein